MKFCFSDKTNHKNFLTRFLSTILIHRSGEIFKPSVVPSCFELFDHFNKRRERILTRWMIILIVFYYYLFILLYIIYTWVREGLKKICFRVFEWFVVWILIGFTSPINSYNIMSWLTAVVFVTFLWHKMCRLHCTYGGRFVRCFHNYKNKALFIFIL